MHNPSIIFINCQMKQILLKQLFSLQRLIVKRLTPVSQESQTFSLQLLQRRINDFPLLVLGIYSIFITLHGSLLLRLFWTRCSAALRLHISL